MASKPPNPADEVGPSSIATFVPEGSGAVALRDPSHARLLETTATLPTIRPGAWRLVLLTLVRKSELIEATWREVDFENAVWPRSRSRG
jgi:integrase